MKKRILSILLVLIFIPSVFLFAGCGDDGYKLSSLEGDYKKIVQDCENVKEENNKIVFDYSVYKIGDESFVQNTINSVQPYNSILSYNVLFDNIMGFVYEYVDECSNNNIEASSDTKNNLKADLDELELAIENVSINMDRWAELIQFNYNGDIVNAQCLSRFKTLLLSYNNLYQKAITFSNSISGLYYNVALHDANPRIDTINFEEFDSSVVVGKLQGRVRYQISNLSQIYVEKYLDGSNMPELLTTKVGENFVPMNLNLDGYQSKVQALSAVLSSDFNAETAVEIANGTERKQGFYNAAIKAYNFQNVLANDYKMFVSACNKVAYAGTNGEISANQAKCKEIINNYQSIIEEYNDILVELIGFLEV